MEYPNTQQKGDGSQTRCVTQATNNWQPPGPQTAAVDTITHARTSVRVFLWTVNANSREPTNGGTARNNRELATGTTTSQIETSCRPFAKCADQWFDCR